MRKWVLVVAPVGVFALVAVLAVWYFAVDVPELNKMRALDSRMDEIDGYVKSKGGVDWDLRRYEGEKITQSWFVPADAQLNIRDGSVEVSPSSESHKIIKITLYH